MTKFTKFTTKQKTELKGVHKRTYPLAEYLKKVLGNYLIRV